MGKRSNLDRITNDYYPTPKEAVTPLIPYLKQGSKFLEPMAGDGRLINHLEDFGMTCIDAWDIDPQRSDIKKCDALKETIDPKLIDCVITNPAWSREILHPAIEHFMQIAPTWLLFDADWAHTTQEKLAKKIGCKTVNELMKHCVYIVAIGRVKWFPESKYSGKDNVCWYKFDINHFTGPKFIARKGENNGQRRTRKRSAKKDPR